MASEVSISNRAIARVGGNLITSLDDASVEASVCKANFADIRDTVLEEHQWSFAIKRYLLPSSPKDNSPSQYSNYFLVPSDVLNVIRAGGEPDDRNSNATNWRREGEFIVADETQLYVKAIVRITDPLKFSPMFSQALMLRLASEIAIPISKNSNLQKSLLGEYGQSVAAAATKDGQQGSSERIRSDRYIKVRHSLDGGSYIGPRV